MTPRRPYHGLSLTMLSRSTAGRSMLIKRSKWLWSPNLTICFVLSACLASAAAYAQTLSEEEIEQQGLAGKPEDHWSVTLGPGLVGRPIYPGASDERLRFVPLFFIGYRDLVSLGPGGFRMNLIQWKGFRAGPVLGFEGGRKEAESPALHGLGDIDGSLTAGGFVSYRYKCWEIYGTARQAITHSGNGLTALVRLDYRAALIPDKLNLSIGPEISLIDGSASQTWFGISQVQSLQSGLPVFTSGGGLKDVGLHASLTYDIGDHFLLHAFGAVKELTGDVSNSPIVQGKTQSLAGFGVAYRF